jgi:nitroimidazol reductase NimA-like FMN-containing flavoprotein (pyridoxamine 5'-phosphate oxidase superfamily)
VVDEAVVPGASACRWSARYRSILGEGDARFLASREDKLRALDALMGKFTRGPFEYDEKSLARTVAIAVTIRTLSGKQAGW